MGPRVGVDCSSQIEHYVDRAQRLGSRSAAQRMLMQYLPGDGHDIRLRVSNRLMLLHPHQPQKHLLHQIRYVRRISQAHSQVATKPPAMLGRNIGNECLFVVELQIGSESALSVPLERLDGKNGYRWIN